MLFQFSVANVRHDSPDSEQNYIVFWCVVADQIEVQYSHRMVVISERPVKGEVMTWNIGAYLPQR